jgi:Tripartite tricarboxylate transporter family receptor
VKLPRRQFLHLAAALPRSRPRASPPHKATRRVQYASWSVLPRVSRPTPDGYTLFLATPANAINATLYPSLNFNFMRDTAPVAGICLGPYVMVVNPMLPTTTVADFTPHVFGELFKMMAGVDLVHVPYRSNYMPDLLGGQVQVSFSSVPASIELIRTGKLRALAVTPSKRLPTSWRASPRNGCRSDSTSNSLSTTGRAQAPISRPRGSFAQRRKQDRRQWR